MFHWTALLVDWNPLVAALAVFVVALASAVPSLVVVFQHRGTRDAISANSITLGKIERATNGTLEDTNAAIRSLRAEVVRLTALVDAKAPPAAPGGDRHV